MSNFTPPPDGARLSPLSERQEWLGSLEISYALPQEGLLWIPGGRLENRIAFDGTSMTRFDADAQPYMSAQMSSRARADLIEAWSGFWLAEDADHWHVVLLHYRGLFRVLQIAPPMNAWFKERVACGDWGSIDLENLE